MLDPTEVVLNKHHPDGTMILTRNGDHRICGTLLYLFKHLTNDNTTIRLLFLPSQALVGGAGINLGSAVVVIQVAV